MQAGDHFVSGGGLMVVIGLQYTVGLDFCEFLHVLSPLGCLLVWRNISVYGDQTISGS